ncbi:MAG: hypothetical protein HYS12_28415 [Planctomycetes bacterium]|nr:hypothetical protein [Planctomycetota bacterium]
MPEGTQDLGFLPPGEPRLPGRQAAGRLEEMLNERIFGYDTLAAVADHVHCKGIVGPLGNDQNSDRRMRSAQGW